MENQSLSTSMAKDVVPFAIMVQIHPKLFNTSPESETESGEVINSSDISNLCQELEQQPFSDAAITAFGNIMLSYTLALGSESFQKGVIFHELGHNLGRIFNENPKLSQLSLKNFQETKKCLLGIHSGLSVDKASKYFAEDYADFVARKLSPSDSRSPDCEFLRYSKDLNEYEQNSYENPFADDPHSIELFRVIKSLIDLNGTIPNSCKTALEQEAILTLPETCHF